MPENLDPEWVAILTSENFFSHKDIYSEGLTGVYVRHFPSDAFNLKHSYYSHKEDTWYDVGPPDQDLYKPKFDPDKMAWVEGATKQEFRLRCAKRVDRDVRDRCRDQGKRETYYLMLALEDRESPEVTKYLKAVDEITDKHEKELAETIKRVFNE